MIKTIFGNYLFSGKLNGRDIAADGTKLDGIAAGAEVNRNYIIATAGRVDCLTTNAWVTDSDDQYGNNIQSWTENEGTGTDPVYEWENMGMFLPAGTTLKKFHLVGSANSTEVTDLELIIAERYPTTAGAWESGFDADGEMTNTEIYRDLYANPTGGDTVFPAGDMGDRRKRTLTLDHTLAQDAMISLYFKPVGTITANRTFKCTVTWEIG